MSHKLYYDSDLDCVILRVEGLVTLNRVRKLAPEVSHLCEKTGCCRLLNDMSGAQIDITIPGLFTSPQIMNESHVSPKIKRALVVPPSFKEAEFLENVTRNRGHNFKIFNDIDDAVKWLRTG